MAITGREPDETLWPIQDESYGHILLIPAKEEAVYEWDYKRDKRFTSEEDAIAWHDTDCPTLQSKRR